MMYGLRMTIDTFHGNAVRGDGKQAYPWREEEKQKKADELRSQEVFMKRSTGIHKCSNCDWEYDPEKGDSFLIGGMIKPGTAFEDLPSNWRCPTCRASKDGFNEVVETIPGFEVNQGYGFGTNSMTSGQKNTLIWGSLGFFLFLFLGGYALSESSVCLFYD